MWIRTHGHATAVPTTSFPRRRESRCDGKPLIQVGLQQEAKCDSRVRGNDGTWMGCAETTTMLRET
jgi:hypothetical protein